MGDFLINNLNTWPYFSNLKLLGFITFLIVGGKFKLWISSLCTWREQRKWKRKSKLRNKNGIKDEDCRGKEDQKKKKKKKENKEWKEEIDKTTNNQLAAHGLFRAHTDNEHLTTSNRTAWEEFYIGQSVEHRSY
jgi:hypothetical protein